MDWALIGNYLVRASWGGTASYAEGTHRLSQLTGDKVQETEGCWVHNRHREENRRPFCGGMVAPCKAGKRPGVGSKSIQYTALGDLRAKINVKKLQCTSECTYWIVGTRRSKPDGSWESCGLPMMSLFSMAAEHLRYRTMNTMFDILLLTEPITHRSLGGA